jgi:hypothetical protein
MKDIGINHCCLNFVYAYNSVDAYTTWEQVAGYFDGDGNVSISDLSNQPYKLSLSLIFTDASIEQVSMLRSFFIKRGIPTSNVLRTTTAAWMIAISRHDSVLSTLKAMLPHLYKKANEAQSVIDYYEGKITGNDIVEVFRKEVEAGRRERRPRKVPIDVPYTFLEGDKLMKENRKAKLGVALGRYRAKVTPEDYEKIRDEHFRLGRRLCDLAREYSQYARETIRRVLGGGRGYVGVKGKGRVNTTDN